MVASAVQSAAQRKALSKVKSIGSTATAAHASANKKYKGKFIGKEKYGGLTKNAPKGKYKGKYIGPDRFKGDVAAWEAYKDKKKSESSSRDAAEKALSKYRKRKATPVTSPGVLTPTDKINVP